MAFSPFEPLTCYNDSEQQKVQNLQIKFPVNAERKSSSHFSEGGLTQFFFVWQELGKYLQKR